MIQALCGRMCRLATLRVLLPCTLMLAAASVSAGTARADGGCGGGAPYAPPCGPGADVVSVTPTIISRPVAPGFLGISLEYNTVREYEDGAPGAANTVLARLIDNLAPGQTPIVRVGGDSTDWTWWPVPGAVRPPGVTNALSTSWAAKARALAVSARARLILGINLEEDNAHLGAVEADDLVSDIGAAHVAALELGNEPMLYAGLPWYHTVTGVKEFGRPHGYDLADYTDEFGRYASELPRVPLAGPSIGHSWIAQLGGFINALAPGGTVTYHAYGINSLGDAFRGQHCGTPVTDPSHPSVSTVLAPFSSLGVTREIAPYVAMAHARGQKFRVDEMNVVTCGGEPGVSDTFASALWVLNAMFALAQTGVDGVNIHSWKGSAGRLFDFTELHRHWSGSVQPEYYGMLMFARAAPAGAQLLQTAQSSPSALEAWSTLAPDRSVRVLLINDSLTTPANAVVHPPRAGNGATITQLLAPSAAATTGVSLNCQSFGTQTTSGSLKGPQCATTEKPSNGAYAVTVPPASAALLAVDPAVS